MLLVTQDGIHTLETGSAFPFLETRAVLTKRLRLPSQADYPNEQSKLAS